MIIIEAGSIIKVEQIIFGLVPISPSHPSNRCKLTKQEALTLERKFFIAEIETCSDMMYRVAWSILRNDDFDRNLGDLGGSGGGAEVVLLHDDLQV